MRGPTDFDHEDPTRWRDQPAGAHGTDAELGAGARHIAGAQGWDDVRVAQVRQALWRRLERGPVKGAPRAWPMRAWALAALSLFLGSAATAVAELALRRHALERAAATRPTDAAPARRSRHLHVAASQRAELDVAVGDDGASVSVREGRVELTGPGLDAPVPLGAGQAWREGAGPPAPPPLSAPLAIAPVVTARASETSEPARAAAERVAVERRRERVAPIAFAPAPLAPAPVEAPAAAAPGEVDLLAEAVRTLRAGDAETALAKIERAQRQFPGGTLAREAALLRAEALLVLGRDAAALQALDAIVLHADAGDRRASLARGELRASAGRCAEAAGDFTRVLATDARDELAARSFYGRGACALAAGDRESARGDLTQALRLSPTGERSAAIEDALKDLAR
jgi:tetratricopeptide (TPR) repeat protein